MQWLAKLWAQPAKFNRICAGVVLIVLMGYALVFYAMRPKHAFWDFDQYYSAALVARYGPWEALYPIPTDPNRHPGFIEASQLKPRTAELLLQHGSMTDSYRFIQSPATAVLVKPLAYLPYRAARCAWGVLMMLCAWGIIVQAGVVYQMIAGRSSSMAGVVMLVLGLSPRLLIATSPANISNFEGLCVGFVTLGLFTGGCRLAAPAMAIGAVVKYYTMPLGLIYLLQRRFKCVGWMILAAVVFVGLTLLVTGIGPWKEFFELGKTFDRSTPDSSSLGSFLGTLLKYEYPPAWLLRAVRLLFMLPAILLVMAVLIRDRNRPIDPPKLAAACVVLLCAVLLASPLYMVHYILFVFPLAGWLFWEAASPGLVRYVVILIGIILLLPLGPIFRAVVRPPFNDYQMMATLMVMGVAVARLVRPNARSFDRSGELFQPTACAPRHRKPPPTDFPTSQEPARTRFCTVRPSGTLLAGS